MPLLLLHILCVLVLIFRKNSENHRYSASMLIIALLVPLFGFLCVLFSDYRRPESDDWEKELDLNDAVLDDEIYRSIHIRPDRNASGIVPVEEALLINEPAQRRKLLLNLLNLKPSDYVPALRKAGVNDDTEVVHYAVTALVELRKEYNERIVRMEEEMLQSPGPEALRKYIALDEEYIHSKLPENHELTERLHHYDELLGQLLSDHPGAGKKAHVLRKRAKCMMALREYEQADRIMDRLIVMEPENEDNYLLKIQCLGAMKDREGIDEVLSLISVNHVFLSDEGRDAVGFWKDSLVGTGYPDGSEQAALQLS